MLNRREFLSASCAATLAGSLPGAATGRKKMAIISNIWTYLSHTQHMGDRFLVGYPHRGRWHKPELDVVSAWVDQRGDDDLSSARAKEFGFTVYPTIAETLRCGGKKLAVDAVLIIGEHGEYPTNAKGQKLYPRYENFMQVVKVFEEDGRAVPVFNDKHLSTSWDKAKAMVAASKRLKFPFLAGSSLPVTWRLPELELPYDCEIEDALQIGVGGSDSHDFHALEALQCMVERRKGGETGVKSVHVIEGDAVWKAGKEGRWSTELLSAALSRSDTLRGVAEADDLRTHDLAHDGELPKLVKNPSAYFIDYNDGLKATLLMLNGAVGDFLFAAKLKGRKEPVSTQFFLPPTPNVTYSACLMGKAEEMFVTGKAPYPVERTMLVSGILDKCLDSRIMGHKRLLTPELAVNYRASRESHFGG